MPSNPCAGKVNQKIATNHRVFKRWLVIIRRKKKSHDKEKRHYHKFAIHDAEAHIDPVPSNNMFESVKNYMADK